MVISSIQAKIGNFHSDLKQYREILLNPFILFLILIKFYYSSGV